MSPRKAKPRTQAPKAPTGQPYGEAGAQLDAQRALPLPDNTALPPAPVTPVQAGSLGAFTRPTERPDEPVTTGAPAGPGPGPEILGDLAGDDLTDWLAALYQASGAEEVRGLLEEAMTRRGET